MAAEVVVIGVPGIPRIKEGDDLGEIARRCMGEAGIALERGDVVVVAQSIVSRAEGSVVRLGDVEPSDRARRYAEVTGKDPGLVEVVLSESRGVLWAGSGFMICETRHGFVCANAGVDASNVPEGWVSTLPADPDASARSLSRSMGSMSGLDVPVIISDSEGRPFRRGAIGVAVGVYGLPASRSLAGRPDYFGRPLQTTEVALADQICSAAGLVMGEAAEGIPVVIVRGVDVGGEGGGLLYDEDVFKEMLESEDN
jgi:coenzyme F420-0:L-glutamate ligase/coenzyme F420-1:gamma-L-glutamate ligase